MTIDHIIKRIGEPSLQGVTSVERPGTHNEGIATIQFAAEDASHRIYVCHDLTGAVNTFVDDTDYAIDEALQNYDVVQRNTPLATLFRLWQKDDTTVHIAPSRARVGDVTASDFLTAYAISVEKQFFDIPDVDEIEAEIDREEVVQRIGDTMLFGVHKVTLYQHRKRVAVEFSTGDPDHYVSVRQDVQDALGLYMHDSEYAKPGHEDDHVLFRMGLPPQSKGEALFRFTQPNDRKVVIIPEDSELPIGNVNALQFLLTYGQNVRDKSKGK